MYYYAKAIIIALLMSLPLTVSVATAGGSVEGITEESAGLVFSEDQSENITISLDEIKEALRLSLEHILPPEPSWGTTTLLYCPPPTPVEQLFIDAKEADGKAAEAHKLAEDAKKIKDLLDKVENAMKRLKEGNQ